MHDMEADGHDVTVMVDPRTRWCTPVVEKTLKLARRCSDFDSFKRPRMREVVSVFRYMLGVLLPNVFCFFVVFSGGTRTRKIF